MTKLKATRATTTDTLFNEIGLLKLHIVCNEERIGELCLLVLEKTFSDFISLKENRKDYKKAFDNYQRALKEAQYYVSKTGC